MKSWILFLTLSLLAIPVQAEISYETLAQLTDQPSTLHGDFKQEKILKEFGTSLISTGEFVYQRDRAIQWVTKSPIETTLMMTPNKIVSTQGDNEILTIDADKNPTAKILSRIFFAIMTADWQRLTNYFNISGQAVDSAWQATLVPNNKSLEHAVLKVELAGDNLLRDMTLYERNGDITHIRFKNLAQ